MLRIALLVKDWGISINEKEEVFGLPRLVLPPVLNVSFRLYSPFSLFFFYFRPSVSRTSLKVRALVEIGTL